MALTARVCPPAGSRNAWEGPTRGRMAAVMSLVVVGSVAFDSVATPFGERERMLGGSATHFSLAASFFTHVRVVGIVGEDFGEEETEVLTRRGIDTEDLERVAGSTFFWRGQIGRAHV